MIRVVVKIDVKRGNGVRKENMPDNFKRAKKILLMQDYIVYMLCGICQIDCSLAARTICFDIENKCWDKEILSFAEIDEKLLSVPVSTDSAAEKIKPQLANELGISADCVIVSGAHDQIAAMCGANISTNEQVMDGTGTVGCVPVLFDDIPKDYELYDMGYSLAPHPCGGYACYVLSYTGGATLKWFRDNFSDTDYAALDKTVKVNPTDLLIMPHFAGAATPYMDTDSKAAILGLTFEHTAVVPEQAQVWVMPMRTDTLDEVTLNMVNAMFLRPVISGETHLLSDEQFAVLKSGVDFYKSIRTEIPKLIPFYPSGTAQFGDDWVVCGFSGEKYDYICVKRFGGSESVEIPIDCGKYGNIELIYPQTNNCTIKTDKNLYISLPCNSGAVIKNSIINVVGRKKFTK